MKILRGIRTRFNWRNILCRTFLIFTLLFILFGAGFAMKTAYDVISSEPIRRNVTANSTVRVHPDNDIHVPRDDSRPVSFLAKA